MATTSTDAVRTRANTSGRANGSSTASDLAGRHPHGHGRRTHRRVDLADAHEAGQDGGHCQGKHGDGGGHEPALLEADDARLNGDETTRAKDGWRGLRSPR